MATNHNFPILSHSSDSTEKNCQLFLWQTFNWGSIWKWISLDKAKKSVTLFMRNIHHVKWDEAINKIILLLYMWMMWNYLWIYNFLVAQLHFRYDIIRIHGDSVRQESRTSLKTETETNGRRKYRENGIKQQPSHKTNGKLNYVLWKREAKRSIHNEWEGKTNYVGRCKNMCK